MQKKILIFSLFLISLFSHTAYALLSMELTRGIAGAIPIVIAPFNVAGNPNQDIRNIIQQDLQNSGRFKVYLSDAANMPQSYFHHIGANYMVTAQVQGSGSGGYQLSFQIKDVNSSKNAPATTLLNRKFNARGDQLRAAAHHVSDAIYQQITGVRGIFSTRIAYIVVQRHAGSATQYSLEVSDQDGYNPRPLLISPDPIMSPAWSPNGKQIAYVSFENHQSAIYIEDIATGARKLISHYHGINGAPAWSVTGRKLAIVLSKNGSPNIYAYDLYTKQLTQLTNDWSINTEPAWSRDDRSIIFTSNRSGGPQIYQKNLATGKTARLTFDGNYNARASFTNDGKHIVVLNKEANLFNIGILDLDTGTFKVLTNSGSDSESPSVAPNGSMVLYGTIYGGRAILAMVASDGSVEIHLPARNGEVQDPAWSPYLS
jgi:TolB protein